MLWRGITVAAVLMATAYACLAIVLFLLWNRPVAAPKPAPTPEVFSPSGKYAERLP